MKLIEDQSLDCPGLQGVLAPTQAVEGFQRQGQVVAEHWCVVRYRDQDAGAVLLTTHPEIGCWELLYMGVVPRWRGHGLGEQIIDEALVRAANAGANLLLLSVDAKNQPALRLYERAGFQVYAKRTLYAWVPETTLTAD
jgi:ribosomal protein S18 acetylase RimI-like enzyme